MFLNKIENNSNFGGTNKNIFDDFPKSIKFKVKIKLLINMESLILFNY